MWNRLFIRDGTGVRRVTRFEASQLQHLDYKICVQSLKDLPVFFTPGAATIFLDLDLGPCMVQFENTKKIVVGYTRRIILDEYETAELLLLSGEFVNFTMAVKSYLK